MTEKTMKDVSHTPPYGNGADRVWERGHEFETDDQDMSKADNSAAEAMDTPTPADD